MLEQLAASELLSEKSPLNKALEKIIEKTDKTKKTCEELMILDREEQDTGRLAPNCLKNMHERNFKRIIMNFQ